MTGVLKMKYDRENSSRQGGRMSRRGFIGSAAAAAMAVSAASTTAQTKAANKSRTNYEPIAIGSFPVAVKPGQKFKLKYAPHFGMFRHTAGNDPLDQIQFMADQGFTALEDNGMMGRPSELQDKIARKMSQLSMTMGVFVASANWGKKTFVTRDKAIRDMLVNKMKKAVEVAKRVNAKWCTVLLDSYDDHMEWDYQTANAIENLKYCADVCEPSGLVMVLESLNWWTDHPGLFLTKIPQAYQICKAVGSPSCKILDDLYHQQITEGNLIPNMDKAWDQIAYFQVGDNPGRKEPTTGEINYRNIFKHIYEKGYKGVIGMEHGNSKPGKEGEMAVIQAYRSCDDF
jgi:hydroxypyruvate isomerase